MSTTDLTAKKMVLLRRGVGKILLPVSESIDLRNSFVKFLTLSPKSVFDLPYDKKFQAVVGVMPENCIGKVIDHIDPRGELIVRTLPGIFRSDLAKKIYSSGTISDVISDGDHLIWRFVIGDDSKKTLVDGTWKKMKLANDQIVFSGSVEYVVPLSDFFSVKVGAVSGCDEAFTSSAGNAEFISSQTLSDGVTKKMFFNVFTDHLLPHKPKLLNRKMRKFNDNNWWMWGRNHYIGPESRVYVPVKSKNKNPFFCHECPNYDGTLLGLFFKESVALPPAKVAAMLNSVNWEELGFKVGGRLIFSQAALGEVLLPKDFESLSKTL